MKPVIVIALLASAIGVGHLWVIALNFEFPVVFPIAAGVVTVGLGLLAGLVADHEEA
jgi:hypothetical protein